MKQKEILLNTLVNRSFTNNLLINFYKERFYLAEVPFFCAC